jgi:hypothetical protein
MRIKTQAEPEAHEYWKKEAFDKPQEEITQEDVVMHRDRAKDHSDLVDKIIHDLHDGRPILIEQLRQENDHGAQPARRGH